MSADVTTKSARGEGDCAYRIEGGILDSIDLDLCIPSSNADQSMIRSCFLAPAAGTIHSTILIRDYQQIPTSQASSPEARGSGSHRHLGLPG
jgi:hypothetical protein